MATTGSSTTPTGPFDDACALVQTALDGPFRRTLAADFADAPTLGKALERLRDAMRRHAWRAAERRVDLSFVAPYDTKTRRDGFHALHDWDGVRDVVNTDMIPVDVVTHLIDERGRQPADATVVAILLDYYFIYLLGLLALRAWDEGDADANLERIDGLLGAVQGEYGSGQRFADDVETLILIATSHYEPNEDGYATLLHRSRALARSHQAKLSRVHAQSMGAHLRFGFEATYGRDTVLMRHDNVTDYPWVCYALAGVMREYLRLRDTGTADAARETIVEAMVNALSCDATAFVGDRPPASLSTTAAERKVFVDGFQACRGDLIEEFEPLRPTDHAYSPLSFFFNFAQNVLKGAVVDALLWGEANALSLNDLLTGVPRGDPKGPAKEKLATTLMGYARANPDTIRGRLMPVIVYDPQAGRRAFNAMMRQIKD